jgi:hypothetical protein
MKKILLLTIVLLVAKLSRADLVIHQRGIGMGATNDVIVSIQGNMMREDGGGDVIGHMTQIIDMSNLDQTMLVAKNKTLTRTPGTKIKEFLKKQEEQTGDTNSLDDAKLQPTSTGKFEKVQGFETEIYFWTNGKNVTNRLWAAKNYPDFENIKPYLAKLDGYHKQGVEKNFEPSVATLTGMVIKREEIIEGQKEVVELISAKVEPVDSSLFVIPSDYKEFKN